MFVNFINLLKSLILLILNESKSSKLIKITKTAFILKVIDNHFQIHHFKENFKIISFFEKCLLIFIISCFFQ